MRHHHAKKTHTLRLILTDTYTHACNTCRGAKQVNNYFRKYRCACRTGFRGHNCDVRTTPAPKKGTVGTCVLRLGAKSASGSTGSLGACARDFPHALVHITNTHVVSRLCPPTPNTHTAHRTPQDHTHKPSRTRMHVCARISSEKHMFAMFVSRCAVPGRPGVPGHHDQER